MLEIGESRGQVRLQSVEVGSLVPSLEETGCGQERQLASLRHPAPPQVLFPGVPTLTAGCCGLHNSGMLAHSSLSKKCSRLPHWQRAVTTNLPGPVTGVDTGLSPWIRPL